MDGTDIFESLPGSLLRDTGIRTGQIFTAALTINVVQEQQHGLAPL